MTNFKTPFSVVLYYRRPRKSDAFNMKQYIQVEKYLALRGKDKLPPIFGAVGYEYRHMLASRRYRKYKMWLKAVGVI
jgi:hypothetical protein